MAFGDGQISNIVRGYPLVITTSSGFSSTIVSLTWNGREFVQSSAEGDNFQPTVFLYDSNGVMVTNPTEAGALNFEDSILLSYNASGNHLTSQVNAIDFFNTGFTNPPTIISKEVTIGHALSENIISYNVIYSIPTGQYAYAAFEILAAYIRGDFSTFYTYNPATDSLVSIPFASIKYQLPLIFAVDSNYAIGGFYLNSQDYGVSVPPFIQYGVKWNFDKGYGYGPGGTYSFTGFIVVGTLVDVKAGIQALYNAYYGGVTISFISPAPGSTVSGTLNVVTEPTGNVVNIKYYIDNIYLFEEQNYPWGFSLNTIPYSNGSHVFKAVAYDSGGGTSEATISYIFNNSVDYQVAVNAAAHSTLSSVLSLTQQYVLVGNAAAQSISSDFLSIWLNPLLIANSLSAIVSSNPLLSQGHVLKGASAYLANGSALANSSALAGYNFINYSELLDNFAWTKIIRGLDAFPADGVFTADGVITAGTNFRSYHSVITSEIVLNLVTCSADNIHHLLLSSLIDLTQLQMLSVDNSSHILLSGDIVVNHVIKDWLLSVDNISHLSTSDNLELLSSYLILLQDIKHSMISIHFDYLSWFGDWRDYKSTTGPWTSPKQTDKWGYTNNPRWLNKE